jgi:hypothetical protein
MLSTIIFRAERRMSVGGLLLIRAGMLGRRPCHPGPLRNSSATRHPTATPHASRRRAAPVRVLVISTPRLDTQPGQRLSAATHHPRYRVPG